MRATDGTHSPHEARGMWGEGVWGARRAKHWGGAGGGRREWTRRGGADPPLSESGVYRCLVRAGVIEPQQRRWRRETWKRWERAARDRKSTRLNSSHDQISYAGFCL